MKLAVSNIAWNAEEAPFLLDLLARTGVTGVELAPTKIWPRWNGITPTSVAAERSRLAAYGLKVAALQSILFDRPDLQVFAAPDGVTALIRHVERTADLAARLGAETLVFGSPRNRDPGELPPAAARARAVEVLQRLGDACASCGVALVLEAVPAAYGCTFVKRWREAFELVRAVNHTAVRFHLDAACTQMAGDDPAAAASFAGDTLAHVHVSEPGHGDFAAPRLDHRAFGRALQDVAYGGWISIEMRREGDPAERVRSAVSFVQNVYPIATT